MVVTRHPERWNWLPWLPHNQHDEMFDASGMRRLVSVRPPNSKKPRRRAAPQGPRDPGPQARRCRQAGGRADAARRSPKPALGAPSLGPHWVIVDDAAGTPEQWEGVTGREGNVRDHRAAHGDRPASGWASPMTTRSSNWSTARCATAARSTVRRIRFPKQPRADLRGPLRAGRRRLPRCRSTPAARARNPEDAGDRRSAGPRRRPALGAELRTWRPEVGRDPGR